MSEQQKMFEANERKLLQKFGVQPFAGSTFFQWCRIAIVRVADVQSLPLSLPLSSSLLPSLSLSNTNTHAHTHTCTLHTLKHTIATVGDAADAFTNFYHSGTHTHTFTQRYVLLIPRNHTQPQMGPTSRYIFSTSYTPFKITKKCPHPHPHTHTHTHKPTHPNTKQQQQK